MVVVETKNDKKTYIDFYVYDSIVQDYKFKMAMLIAIACFAAAGVFQYINEHTYRDTALVVGIVIIVLWIMQFFMRMYRNLKSYGLDKASVGMKYEINDKKVVWHNKKTGQSGATKWDTIIKAKNNGKYIYLYPVKNFAMVINLEHITEGTPEQLKKIISNNVKGYKA